MSTGVNAAIKKARDAGLYVIALDTPPDPADTVDITFATDNLKAGKLDRQVGGVHARRQGRRPSPCSTCSTTRSSPSTTTVTRASSRAWASTSADPKKNGDEAKTGKYTGGKGGDYTIVCNEPSNGAEDGGRTAMENCLTKNPDINVVYTINEPAAVGANAALKAAGITDALIVSVDGGCAGVKSVKDGIIGATAQQYPLKMATLGMEAIAKIARGGEKPTTSEGLDFFNTGVALVTDKPAAGVDSITTDEALEDLLGLTHDVVVHIGCRRRVRSAAAEPRPAAPAPAPRLPVAEPAHPAHHHVRRLLDPQPAVRAAERACPCSSSRPPSWPCLAHRPDPDHPHRRHRPVGRRDHHPRDDDHGHPRRRRRAARAARPAHRHRRSAWRPGSSTASS